MLGTVGILLGPELFEEGQVFIDGNDDLIAAQSGFDSGDLFQRLGDAFLEESQAKLHGLGFGGKIDDQAAAAHAGFGAGQDGDLESFVRIVAHDFPETRQLAVDDIKGDVRGDVVRAGAGAAQGEDERAFFLVAQADERRAELLAVVRNEHRDELRRLEKNGGDDAFHFSSKFVLFGIRRGRIDEGDESDFHLCSLG